MQEAAALVDGLLVGIDFLDVLQLRAGICQKIVVDLQPEGAHNVEIVLDHQVINLGNRAGGGVFNGQNAILAEPLVNGLEHAVKGLEVQDHGIGKDFFTGQLRISTLHALTGHHGGLREEVWGILNGLGNSLIELPGAAAELALVAATQFKEHGIQGSGVVCHVRPGLFCYILQFFPLPGGHQNGQAICFLILCHLGAEFHPAAEQLHQLIIDIVNLVSEFCKIHGLSLLSVK